MGKGDIKTRRGKIYRGTYGVSRQRRKMKKVIPHIAPEVIVPILTEPRPIAVAVKVIPPKVKPKKATPKKAAPKKVTPKKPEKKKTVAKKQASKRKKV